MTAEETHFEVEEQMADGVTWSPFRSLRFITKEMAQVFVSNWITFVEGATGRTVNRDTIRIIKSTTVRSIVE